MQKKIKRILYVSLLILIAGTIFLIFKIEMAGEKQKNDHIGYIEDGTILPTPDRIIYKNQNNQYFIIYSNTNAYREIYSELYNRITNIIEGKVYSEEEIRQKQENGSFIEFDYDSKSKNFVFMLEETEMGIIKRLSDHGQVIQSSLSDADSLIKKMDHLTENMQINYDFNIRQHYTSENKLSKITEDLQLLSTKVAGVYKKIVEDGDHNNYEEILKKLNFKTNQEIPSIDFTKQSIVITVSRYEIQKIDTNIGNIKYELGKFLDGYLVDVLIVSKVVNTKCIYYNTNLEESKVEQFSINNKENGVEYYVENGKYYTTLNQIKTEIISLQTASDLATTEAKKEKYQYQGWKSEFYSIEDENDTISGELILGLDEISKLYHWREEWQNKDYEGKLIWKIRLFDRNDPLTSLYIYIDAVNGNVIGAGDSSD